MFQILFVLLIINILSFYVFLSYLFGYSNFQLSSIVAEIFTLLIGLSLSQNIRSKSFEDSNGSASWIPIYLIFVIIIGNALIGIINMDFIFSQIDFGKTEEQTGFNVKRISTLTGSASIFIAQTGGFFIQLFLTFFLVQIFDLKLKFIDTFRTLGFAYIGFVIVSISTYLYNLFYLDYFYSLEDFNQYASNSLTYLIMGKLGEYITLIVAAFIFCKFYNIKLSVSLSITFVPNILLLSSYELKASPKIVSIKNRV